MSDDLIKVAVTSLCEFAARTGSLEFRYTPAPTASEGIIGHMTVQQRRPDPYVAEYLIQGECEGLAISGRVDGYYANPQQPYLEEIKTHRGNLSRIGPGRRSLHWAQLKVYGALLCQRDEREGIDLRLTYFEVRDEVESTEDEYYTAEELSDFLKDLCTRYARWAKKEQLHRELRNKVLLDLSFPHGEFRKGQRALSASVYRAARRGDTLQLQAPTGIGKTVGVLFPALKAMPEANLDRIFFLTNRNTGRQLGLHGLQTIIDSLPEFPANAANMLDAPPSENPPLMQESADDVSVDEDSDNLLPLLDLTVSTPTPPLRVLELASKEASCDHPDKACHGDSCPLAHSFFDKLPAARAEAVSRPVLNTEVLKEIAFAHDLCRYFLGQEMARWSDVVVADVNHYYDQFALLYALTIQNDWRVMPVIDEAHNLIDRARSMYSMELGEAEMLYTIRNAPKPLLKPLSDLEKAWAVLIESFLTGRPRDQQPKQTGGTEFSNDPKAIGQLRASANTGTEEHQQYYLDKVPDELNSALYSLIAAITDYLTDHPADGEVQQVLFTALGFLRLAESFDDHSLCTLLFEARLTADQQIQGTHKTGSARLRIDNLIPADHLRPRFVTSASTVLFSATLSPPHYHRDLLGLPETSVFEDIESPFQREQIDLRLVTGISTRQHQRQYSIAPICHRIARQMEVKPGNYLVYVSSFEYLNTLYQFMLDEYPTLRLLRQRPGMPPFERETFIQEISDGCPSVGFAVLGGVFGEGIDLPGDKLIGVFVATLGLPPHDDLHEVLRERLEARYGNGYDYTYLYPGLQKVIQAAGRLIRTPDDTGVIELIDDRFSKSAVKALLPRWWEL